MINGSVAPRLTVPAFRAQCEYWLNELGDQFPTFLCESVAVRLCEPEFKAMLLELKARHWGPSS